MANKTISDLTTELAAADVAATADLMEIDDVSAGVTKKVKPRSIVHGGGGLLRDGSLPMSGDLDMDANDIVDTKSLTIANAVDANHLVNLSRTFAGAGRLVDGTMGASTTDHAIQVTMPSSAAAVIRSLISGISDETKLSGEGIRFKGTTNAFRFWGEENAGVGVAGRALDARGADGSAGDGGTVGGVGGAFSARGGSGGGSGGAGGGAGGGINLFAGIGTGAPGGSVNVIAGAGTPNGNIFIGASDTAVVSIGGAALPSASMRADVVTITGEDAGAGAVVLEASDAGSSIKLKVSGDRVVVDALATTVTGFLVATRNLLLTSPSVKTATYTITREDLLIRVDSGGGAFNLELPDPAQCNRWHCIVKDVDGSLGTNAVTLVRFGSEKIEGVAADYVLQANYGSWHLWCDGTDWWLI